MNLPTEIFGDVIVVHTPDELGTHQCEEFEAFASTLERDRAILDLDSTELLDSKGLTSILNVQAMLQRKGGDLKIAATNATNRKILEVTRLDQQLEVFDGMIDAVKSFH